MKKKLLCAACTSWVLAAGVVPAYAQDASSPQVETAAQRVGVVSGSVINPASGNYMSNAIVRISSSAGTRTVTTGERGEFQLGGVAAGKVEILVSFTGYNSERQTIELAPGENKRLEFALSSSLPRDAAGADDATDLGTVQVLGAREGDARAIMEQRASMNVINSLSAESFGEIGDGNPGEFLKNMPGLDYDTVADDVPRNISMHGLPARYTGITLNGIALGGVDANNGAGSSRQVSFEQMALTGVDSITTYSTVSADMDGNAPAGTIDFRTRKAYDAKGRKIDVSISESTASSLWDSKKSGPREGGMDGKFTKPSFNLRYSDVFLDGRLGVAVGASSTYSYLEQVQNTSNRDYIPTANSPEPYVPTTIAPNEFQRLYNRRALNGSIDFKATDDLSLSLMAFFGRGTLDANQITPTFNTNIRASGIAGNAAGDGAGTGDPATDFTTNNAATYSSLSIGNPSYDYKIGYSRSVVPSFEWSTENFKLDGNLFYAGSNSRYASAKGNQVKSLGAITSTGNFSASRSDVYDADWDIQQTSGPDWSLPSSFTISGKPAGSLSSGSSAESRTMGGALNFTFYSDIAGVPVTWKTGGKRVDTRYWFNNTSGLNGWTYDGPLSNAEFLEAIQSENEYGFGSSDMSVTTLNGGQMYMPSMRKIWEMMQANPGDFTYSRDNPTPETWLAANVTNNRKFDEVVNALYFMGSADFGDHIKVQAGLRWEQTRDTSYDFNPLPPAEVAAAGYAVDAGTGNATTTDGLKYQYLTNGRTKRKGKYDNFLPSASIKYSITDSLDLIAGYSHTVMRPEVGSLAGAWSVAYGDEGETVVTAPNVNLAPETSDNFVLRAVKYFEPVGLISLDWFHNRIKNGIVSTSMSAEEFGYTGDEYGDNPTFVTSVNSSDQTITTEGYVFSFNHAMDYLPGWLSGLTVRGSYMASHPSIEVERFATHVAQLGFAWKYGPVRLNMNALRSDEKSRGRTGSIATPGGTITQSQPFIPYTEVNLSGSYTFIEKRKDNFFGLEAFFTINNVFDQHRGTWYANDEVWPGADGHHSQIYIESGRKATIGLRGHF